MNNIQKYLQEAHAKEDAHLPSMKPVFASLKKVQIVDTSRAGSIGNTQSSGKFNKSVAKHSITVNPSYNNLASNMTAVTPAKNSQRGKEQYSANNSPIFANTRRVIKPVLSEPESPSKIKSALKFSPRMTGGQESFKEGGAQDIKLSTIKGFGSARTVSFDVDN